MLDGHDRRFYAPAAGRSPSALRAWSNSERGAQHGPRPLGSAGVGEERRSRGAEVFGEPRAGRGAGGPVALALDGVAEAQQCPAGGRVVRERVARGDPGRERARGLHVAARPRRGRVPWRRARPTRHPPPARPAAPVRVG